MKNKSILSLLSILGIATLSCPLGYADEPQSPSSEELATFKKDRAAILAMVGEFKVSFKFHETYGIKDDYKLKEKIYNETAHEIVKVVEDTENRIVLQHLLLVDHGLEEMVVKHWGQVWTFEDTEVLEYQGGTTWKKRQITPTEAKGTWTQYVTQTDDSPRYESQGTWNHDGGSSIWISQETPRPLPRREYKKRKDYDVLMGINTHAISANGWIHAQANRKLVKRDGKMEYLCAERGYNTYERIESHDFSAVHKYWESTAPFWSNMRTFWNGQIKKSDTLSYHSKIKSKSLGKTIRSLAPSKDKKSTATLEEITTAVEPFVHQKS